jgi:tetratricopeptide (TPR) repeat protein
MLNQAWLFFRYLLTWLLPCPCWMSVDLRVAFPAQLLAWPQAIGAAGYVAWPIVAVVLLLRGGRRGLLGFGMLYPWLLGLTEMVVVRAQEPFVLYRSYLWMSGLPAVLPAIAPRVAPGVRHGVLAAACVALVPLAAERIGTFASPLRLWDDAVRKSQDSGAPYRERALVNRGELLRGAGQAQAALADYNAALDINPRLAVAYVGRATLFLEQGRPREALADLDRGLALDGGNASALAKRCFAKATLNVGEAEVLADCDRARALDPRDPEVAAIAQRVRRRLAGPRGGG